MTTPTTFPITIGDVATELGIALPLSLGDTRVLNLAGKTMAPISLGDLLGKSATASAMSGTMPDVYDSDFPPGANVYLPVPVSLTFSGGTAPFAFDWHLVTAGDIFSIENTNATYSNARFYVNRFAEAGEIYTGIVGCTITDGVGNPLTLQCNVTLELV